VILTIDLGTSVTKTVLWGDHAVVAVGRSTLDSSYGPGNRTEQDPRAWWPSVIAACAEARSALGSDAAHVFGAVEALGFAAARQTFVPVTADGTPLGPALLWSDRRAGREAMDLANSFGDDGANAVRRRTGIVLDAGSVAAKMLWLARCEPDRLRDARWLLAPRDLVAWHLTGEVSTDFTLASAAGLFEVSGDPGDVGSGDVGAGKGGGGGSLRLVPGLVDSVAGLLPVARSSSTVLGRLLESPAHELGLPAGIPVVIGAGDRACEVLGTRASATWPMVSWGTTANVSVPVAQLVDPPLQTVMVTRGALGGWLLEGGLSAAGSLVDWLARLAGIDVPTLMQRARSSPAGSRGVVALPWFGGARAPWWRDTARGAVVGLSFDHDIGDMARAVVESVAWDVRRCLESVTTVLGEAATPVGLALGGGGATVSLWTEILTAVTGLPARRRRSGEAASSGAAMLVAHAIGAEIDFDRVDPIDEEISPDPSMTACYSTLRPLVDAAAAAIIDLGGPPTSRSNDESISG